MVLISKSNLFPLIEEYYEIYIIIIKDKIQKLMTYYCLMKSMMCASFKLNSGIISTHIVKNWVIVLMDIGLISPMVSKPHYSNCSSIVIDYNGIEIFF